MGNFWRSLNPFARIEAKIDALKDSVDNVLKTAYEVAERAKKLEREREAKELVERLMKGEKTAQDWRSL